MSRLEMALPAIPIESAPRDGTKIRVWREGWPSAYTASFGFDAGRPGWFRSGILMPPPSLWEPFVVRTERPEIQEGESLAAAFLKEAAQTARGMFKLPDGWRIDLRGVCWTSERSFGGCDRSGPFVFLRLLHLLESTDEEMAVVREYGMFENDPDIGEIETSDWRLHLKAIVVHEAAHAVQHGFLASDSDLHRGRRFYEGLGCFESSHGPFFQEIYRRLRRELVNPSASGSRVGRPGAKTRMSSRPDLSQVPHACAGKTIRLLRLGGCEAVEFLGRSVLAWVENGECPLKRLPAARFNPLYAWSPADSSVRGKCAPRCGFDVVAAEAVRHEGAGPSFA